MPNAKFYLNKHWWMGQIVIRAQPVVHYDLRLDEGKDIHRYWNLDKDPTYINEDITAVGKTCDDRRWLVFTGTIPPHDKAPDWLKPGNPNKRIEAHVDRIDEGEVSIIEDSPTFISFRFQGKELKGYWIMKKPIAEENVWTFEKSELPKAKVELDDTTSTSMPEIARKVWWAGKPVRAKKMPRIEEKKVGSISYIDEDISVVEFGEGDFQMYELDELEEPSFVVMKSFVPMKSSRLAGVSSFVEIKILTTAVKPTVEMPYIVEENIIGSRIIAHKHGDNVKIFSSDRHEVTEALPTIEEGIRKLNKEDLIVDGVLACFDSEGKPMPKRLVENIFKDPSHDDSHASYFIFDILFYRDNTLEDLKLYERKKVLNLFNYGNHIRKLPFVLVKDVESLAKAVKFVSLLDRSLGAFVKDANSLYHFAEQSDKWIEFGIKHD